MHAVDLLTTGAKLSDRVVERWVGAALTEAAALRELDDQLYPAENDPARLDRARRLHAAWGKWAQEAETLLRLVLAADTSGAARRDVQELRAEVAFAKALIVQSPELILDRIKQLARGEAITVEEVRLELRTGHRP